MRHFGLLSNIATDHILVSNDEDEMDKDNDVEKFKENGISWATGPSQ